MNLFLLSDDQDVRMAAALTICSTIKRCAAVDLDMVGGLVEYYLLVKHVFGLLVAGDNAFSYKIIGYLDVFFELAKDSDKKQELLASLIARLPNDSPSIKPVKALMARYFDKRLLELVAKLSKLSI